MSEPKEPRQMTPIVVHHQDTIHWKSDTGLEGTITLDDNAEWKAIGEKISAALRSYELNTGRAPVMFEMMIFLREIS